MLYAQDEIIQIRWVIEERHGIYKEWLVGSESYHDLIHESLGKPAREHIDRQINYYVPDYVYRNYTNDEIIKYHQEHPERIKYEKARCNRTG